MDNMEVFTTRDKSKRDELYRELRANGLPNEKQAVRFSGAQPVLDEDGNQKTRTVQYLGRGRTQIRPIWESNYSVAYPRELSKS
jgi:hypothetical protein